MRWRYYIPHVWTRKQTVWQDVHLFPDDATYKGEPIWLTVDGMGSCDDNEERARVTRKLAGRRYYIDGTDMRIAAEGFTKEELLDWVLIWLANSGFAAEELVEVELDEIRGRSDYLGMLGALGDEYEDDDEDDLA